MLIGLNGYRSAGKDTVGEYLVEHYGFTLKKFADPLYNSAAALLGIPRSVLEKHKDDPEAGIEVFFGMGQVTWTFRQFLQRYGTEAHRDIFGEDFWVEQCLNDYDNLNKRIVITDARFENELQAIRDLAGLTFRIERDTEGASDVHRSEARPSDSLISVTINNNGTFEDLYKEVDFVMKTYCGIEKGAQ